MAEYKRQGSIDDENFRYLADSSNEVRKDMSDNMNTDFVNLQTGIVNILNDIKTSITNESANIYTVYECLNTFFNMVMPYIESLDDSLKIIAEKMEGLDNE